MGARHDGRIVAFQTLYRYEIARAPLAALLDFSWNDGAAAGTLSHAAVQFARLLVAGCLEELDTVDATIGRQLEHWEIDRISRVDLSALRLGVYSLLHQPEIPSAVTIDESVAIAKRFGGDESYRFVNGVLDGIRKGSGRSPRPRADSSAEALGAGGRDVVR
jgi:N utilization substance protein B